MNKGLNDYVFDEKIGIKLYMQLFSGRLTEMLSSHAFHNVHKRKREIRMYWTVFKLTTPFHNVL